MLVLTKFKCVWNKYAKNETMKVPSSSGIYKTVYYCGSYLLLLGKRKWQRFQINFI